MLIDVLFLQLINVMSGGLNINVVDMFEAHQCPTNVSSLTQQSKDKLQL